MKITKTGKWTLSQDEKYWSYSEEFDSKEKAIEFGREECCHENFYVGQKYDLEFDGKDLYDPCERIIEELDIELYEEIGEASEYWRDEITREQELDLNKMINDTVLKWIEKNKLQPNCFKIDNVELIIGDYEYEEDD